MYLVLRTSNAEQLRLVQVDHWRVSIGCGIFSHPDFFTSQTDANNDASSLSHPPSYLSTPQSYTYATYQLDYSPEKWNNFR